MMDPEELARKGSEAAERFRAMVFEVDKVELDYSREAVDRLSELISNNRQTWKKQMDPNQLHKFTELMGCYYGECLRQIFGGSWVWMGEDAAIRVDGVVQKASFMKRLTGAKTTQEIHFGLPISNVESHLERGDEKALAMLFRAFEALVRGTATSSSAS